MTTTYYYTPVTGGYRWNMLQRILHTIGIEPIGSGDSGGQTFLTFDRELTAQEKTDLDALMADNPTLPPVTANTVYTIVDVWEKRTDFMAAMGLTYQTYYSESVPGSGLIDVIELHFSKVLTNGEKNKVVSEYGKLISIK